MATREIIEIDETKCDGCGACESGCPEGALRVIDGKARLVGESLCDGLGACIGTCPRGAITVTRREAEVYDETKVMEGIAKGGPKVIAAHLEHLRSHGQEGYAREALAWLAARGIQAPTTAAHEDAGGACGGCPGTRSRRFHTGGMRMDAARALAGAARTAEGGAHREAAKEGAANSPSASPSALTHWPIQLHLVNPRAPQYASAELLVAADCTAFALGSFHAKLLAGKSLVIACPKLDQGREIYIEKLAALLDSARSVTVAVMEVPCCSGLVKLVLEARERTRSKLTIETLVVGIEGGVVRQSKH